MNADLWFKLFNALAILASGVLNVYLFFKSKTDQRFAEHGQSIAENERGIRLETAERKAADNDIDRRLIQLETEFKSVPTHEDLEEIRAALGGLGTSLATVNERSRGTLDAVRRIEQHLLERPR